MNFLQTTRGKVIAGLAAGLILLTLCVSCSRPAYNPGYAGVPAVQYAPQQIAPVAPAVVAQPAPVIVQNGSGSNGSHLGETIVGTAVGSTIGTMLGNHLTRDRQPTMAPRYTTPQPSYVAPAQRYVPRPQAARPTIRAKPSTKTSIRIGKTR